MNNVAVFEKNTKGKDYVVGDIHGCFTKLECELYTLGFDESKDRLFSVGDLIDRGSESEKCLEWLSKPWFHAVRGNHEQMLIDAFYFDEKYNMQANGGMWYFDLDYQEQEYYATILDQLPYGIEVINKDDQRVGIVHADCPFNSWDEFKNSKLQDGDKAWCLWSRHAIRKKYSVNFIGIDKLYVGHTPLNEVTILGNTVFIDTGAVFDGGKLTIMEI